MMHIEPEGKQRPYIHWLRLFAGGGAVFGGLLYYLGRQYTDSYYESLGIPPTALDFTFWDYIYFGLKSWSFLIAFAVSIFVVQFARTSLGTKPDLVITEVKRKQDKKWHRFCQWLKQLPHNLKIFFHPKKHDPQIYLLYWYFDVVFIAGFAFVFILYFIEGNDAAKSFIGIMYASMSVIFGFLLFSEQPTLDYIKRHQKTYLAFKLAICVVAVLTIQLLPSSWGNFMGIWHTDRIDSAFPKVVIYAEESIGPSDIDWKINNLGYFESNESLALLLETRDYLYLRQTEDDSDVDSIAIRKSAIYGMDIHISERWRVQQYEMLNETNDLPEENAVTIRKQVYELTQEDLEEFPVWEFALDEEGEEGQDEATVRPYQYTPPLDARDGMMVSKANFILADGTSIIGYLSPPIPEDTGIESLHPTIIVNGHQISFWYGILKPDPEIVSANYEILGRSSEEVFPIQYTSMVNLKHGEVRGTIDGFMYSTLELETIYTVK